MGPAGHSVHPEHSAVPYSESIDALIDRLARTEAAECVYNQYGLTGRPERLRANGRRRENLRLYLRHMTDMGPKVMLVGEAPGYRGCRLTGVPFTSERILLTRGKGSWPQGARRVVGPGLGYQKTDERGRVTGEASATIVWQAIETLCPLPLLWNAFPFHPFRAGQPMSNRQPTKRELAVGVQYVVELSMIYGIELVVAVGKAAESALERAKIKCCPVRHPSHGGKAQFVAGIRRISRQTGAM